MIVQCPKCGAKYRIDDSKIPEEGISLRCAKCQNVFRIPEEVKESEPVQEPEIPSIEERDEETVGDGIAEEKQAGGKKKILIADDAKFFRTMLNDILKEAGYEIVTAEDGEDALQKIKHELPDLVVLDLQLPKITGFDVLKEMRKGALGKQIPVLVMSGVYTETSHVMAVDTLGANDYVGKSASPDHIVSRVKKLLGDG